MTFETAEADRRIANLVQIGVVTAVDGDGTARVQVGQLATLPLPVAMLRMGRHGVWWMPSVGEQVVILAPSGDVGRGVVMCSIPAGNAPSSDVGTPMIDLSGDDMVIKGGTLRIEADLDITGRLDITGDVSSQANVLAVQNVTAGGGIGTGGSEAPSGGGVAVAGGIKAAGDVEAGDVSLRDHRHGGVSSGSGTSGRPA